MDVFPLLLYALASFAAGIVNSLAGGGSFMTFPALLFTGLDPRAANVTSTVALYPTQVATGYAGRTLAGGTEHLSFRAIFIISVIGGAVGAGLLLLTPPAFFGHLVPWLILFATTMFAWGTFLKKPIQRDAKHHLGKWGTIVSQSLISIYGGYFGGGIGFLMLAALTLAGMAIKKANATKNILAAAMNGAALLIFVFSHDVAWLQVAIGIPASVLGGQIGVRLIHKVNERVLRIAVIAWGLFLTIALFVKG